MHYIIAKRVLTGIAAWPAAANLAELDEAISAVSQKIEISRPDKGGKPILEHDDKMEAAVDIMREVRRLLISRDFARAASAAGRALSLLE